MDDMQELLTADAQRRDAMIAGDVDGLSRLLDDELVWTHSSGRTDDKTAFLGAIADGTVTYLSLETEDVSVSRHGEVYLCHGILNGRASRDGAEKALRNKFLSVWRRANGAFAMLAWQSTGF
jgi:ketosteroid isomerase-like protein